VVDEDFTLSSGRVRARLRQRGGPLVLLVHGNSSCKDVFAHQIGVLARAGFDLAAPDLPGHGASENARAPRRVYSFPGYAGVLRELLDAVSARDVHVVGWSLGGHIGLELLATDRRVRSLLITGTPPIAPGPACVEVAFLASPAMALTGKRRLSAREAVTYGVCMMGGRSYLAPHLLAAIRRTDGAARFWMVRNGLGGIGSDEVGTVRKARRPLAVLHGERDPFVNAEYIQGLSYGSLWRGGVQRLDAGHAPHWQRPRLFNRHMLTFLRAVA